ncbi:Ribosome maturation protein SBDS, N-terminal [Ceraceosorus bombacis]|uniref:Ribosome maturation protein SBDS, N-terminal n=1 Tax=Ceraceosorus bombacis TaxID=401625 RepID=A0A0P1BKT6_9BASI|nr:Ribosome maturation protein SBDS, N-terminal [Ceraceosorus bombacis]
MPKSFHKVVYHPEHNANDLFQVIVNGEEYKKWKAGELMAAPVSPLCSTIPLADVVDSFQIFHTGQGAQGIMGKPSRQDLDNFFGTHNDTDVVLQILQKGDLQNASAKDGFSSTNDGKSGAFQASAGATHGGR